MLEVLFDKFCYVMTQVLKAQWVPIVTVIIALGFGYGAGIFSEKERLEEIVAESKLETVSQQTVLATLSEAMSRGGSDSITEQVIKDCSANERNRFDDLLARLAGGLGRSELVELSRLFDRCGSFYARQKAVMAARLEREVEVYAKTVERELRLVGGGESEGYALSDWQELVKLEKDQSELFSKLVVLQESIISTLLEGETQDSQKIKGLLEEATEVYEMLSYTAVKLKEKRDSLPTAL